MTNTKNDLFTEWISKVNTSTWIKIALTDRSYRTKYERDNGSKYMQPINSNLATYGDNVLKLALSDIIYDVNALNQKLTEIKKEYESDNFLVSKVARHYNLIDVIIKDDNDDKMAKDYNYVGGQSRNNAYKFIATAVEALIGAIYKETKDLELIKSIVDGWRNLLI